MSTRQTPQPPAGDIRAQYEDAQFELIAAAAETAEGAPPKRPTFKVQAYQGGPLYLPGFGGTPVVVDLQGMKTRTKTPVCREHDRKIPVGHTTSMEKGNTLVAAGVFSGTTENTAEIVEMAKNGFPWQASILATPTEWAYLDRGEKATVNAQQISGPAYIARQSILREITIAAIGVDETTTFQVEAAHRNTNTGAPNMGAENGPTTGPATIPPTNPPAADIAAAMTQAQNDAAAANLERIGRIQDIGTQFPGAKFTPNGGQPVDLIPHAIRAGWTPEQTELEARRQHRPTAEGGFAIHSRGGEAAVPEVIEAAVCRGGGLQSMEKQFRPETLERLDTDRHMRRGIGLQQLLIMAAALGGMMPRPGRLTKTDVPEVLRAAFSTNTMASLLSNIANRFIFDGFNTIEKKWQLLAKRRPVSDFRETASFRLSADGEFQPIPASGEIPAGRLSDTPYGNKARPYGIRFAVTREQLINDDIGALTETPRAMARGAHKALNRIFWAEWLANASTFWAAGANTPNNYFAGASSALSITSLSKAQAMLRQMKDSTATDAGPLDTAGKFVVCSSDNEGTAENLYKSELIVGNNEKGNRNIHAGKYQPIATAYLVDPDAWWLTADPEDIPTIEISFLDGQEEPLIEEAMLDTATAGIVMRGFFDFGVRKQAPQGSVMSKGKA